MRIPPYLLVRDSGFYFRIAIPLALRPRYGKTEIRKSLCTHDCAIKAYRPDSRSDPKEHPYSRSPYCQITDDLASTVPSKLKKGKLAL